MYLGTGWVAIRGLFVTRKPAPWLLAFAFTSLASTKSSTPFPATALNSVRARAVFARLLLVTSRTTVSGIAMTLHKNS